MRFSIHVGLALLFALTPALAKAHPPSNTSLPPTKASPDLEQGRMLMDAAKTKLAQSGKYACCIKAPEGSKSVGCDICARNNGSCSCAANLAAGEGVCGECLGAWRSGRGAIPGVSATSVKLLVSPSQRVSPTDAPDLSELVQARDLLNRAKRTLVSEGRFSCCVGKGGCDECAYEKSCPCGREAAEGAAGEGICGQCYDGWAAGIGRLAGLTADSMKLESMSGQMAGMSGMGGAMSAVAGVSMAQLGSGTSWQPAAGPSFGGMKSSGRWDLMTDYNAFFSYDAQTGPRGGYKLLSTNWGMLMADRSVGHDQLELRAMLSLEPLTATPSGYPLLFQSGEQYNGKPLVDQQHPHDLFMELAAKYTHRLSPDSAVFLYAAPAGEPALGPTAFPHRISAIDIPMAPITHHWQDSTHIDFGVLTLGAWKRNVQVEGSYFTGREPDQYRYDLSPFHPDSFSGRVTYNPNRHWSLQTSYGYIHSPEALNPGQDVRRTTVSASYTTLRPDGGFLATTFGYGNNSEGGQNSGSYLLEADLNLAKRNTLFLRGEYVDKLGEELSLQPADQGFGVGELTLGYVHDVTPNRPYETGVGAAVTFDFEPAELRQIYGSHPMGFWLFVRLRPSRMKMHMGSEMH